MKDTVFGSVFAMKCMHVAWSLAYETIRFFDARTHIRNKMGNFILMTSNYATACYAE